MRHGRRSLIAASVRERPGSPTHQAGTGRVVDSSRVSWKRRVNALLLRTTGFEMRRQAVGGAGRVRRSRSGDRLVKDPAFILCSIRSGSTLLRVLLDSHSHIHAPPELHLGDISVGVKGKYAERWLREFRLEPKLLEYLLWDRMLHRELQASGKRVIVNKNPSDAFIAGRIRECWPDARMIFLLRHPLAIARSRQRVRPQDTVERNLEMVLRYCSAVEAARQTQPGLTVRYEDLATDPAAVTRQVCAFLDVRWEAGMLEYGRLEHGRSGPGLGDWTENLKSGEIQPPGPPPAPEEVPEALRDICAAWGYLPVQASAGAQELTSR
jgi:Sulfotransferase family